VRISVRGTAFDVLRGNNDSFWKAVASNSWEPETFALFERFLDRDHSYIDIGAWIGPTVLYGSQIAKLAYGLEPDPIAFAELKQNVVLNPSLAHRIRLFNACIAQTSGSVAFGSRGTGGDSTSSLLFSAEKTSWSVTAFTFEDFVRANGIDDCNFIKMDIEGGEYEVLPTMLEYLQANRPTLHLSLHPCYLKSSLGLIGEMITRVRKTLNLLQSLSFYKHIYDDRGCEFTRVRLLRLSRAKITFDVVLTDQDWCSGRT
jgi:FkbM family methyltransferase